MAKNWISSLVIEKGADCRRWLSQAKELERDDPIFSISNDSLIVHLRFKGKKLFAQVLQVDYNRPRTVLVGDGQTKIQAVFARPSSGGAGQYVWLQDFEIVIDLAAKPENRVTLRISDCDLGDVKPVQLSSATHVEHIPGVQKLLKSLKKPLKILNRLRAERQSDGYVSETMSSPMRSQTGDDDSGTQAEFSTQAPGVYSEQETRFAPRHLMKPNHKVGRLPTIRPAEEGLSRTKYLLSMIPDFPRIGAKESGAPTRSVLYSNQGKMLKKSIDNNNSSEDAEALGDSEKGNMQETTGDNDSMPETVDLPTTVITTPDFEDSSLEDDMFKGMKRIPRQWFKIPKDQRRILDSAESWVRPSLPENVLQELRKPMHHEQTAEWHIMDNTNPSLVENDGGASESDSDEDAALEEEEEAEAATNQQLIRDGLHARNGGEKRLGGTAVTLVETEDQEVTTDQYYSNAVELPKHTVQMSSAFSANEEVPSSGRAPSIATWSESPRSIEKIMSWSPSPEHDQEVEKDPHRADLDESAGAHSEQYEAANLVQVVASMPIMEEDEDEGAEDDEEMDVAEPSAIGEIISAEEGHPTQNGLTSQPGTSTASQGPIVVEVERTQRFKISRPEVKPNPSGLPADNFSMNVVVPGTAEEEVSNTLPLTRFRENLEVQSSLETTKSIQQTETDVSKYQARTSAEQASSPIAPRCNALHQDQDPLPETRECLQQEASSTWSRLPEELALLDRENSISPSSSQKARTSRHCSPDHLEHDQDEEGIDSRHDSAQQAAMGQRYSLPHLADAAAEVNHKGLASSASFEPSLGEKLPTNSYPEGYRTGRGSLKRTSFEAELDVPSPREKRRVSDRKFSVSFTPGTQPPVDLEELKRSNRHDFLRGCKDSGLSSMPPKEFSHKSSSQQRPEPDAKGLPREEADTFAHNDYEEGKAQETEHSDLPMRRDRLAQTSPTSGQQTNIYERYRQTYPSFADNMHAFIRAAVYIEWLTPQYLMPMLWDDFVHKFCHDYENYVVKCSNSIPAINPVSGVKWYNEYDSFSCDQRILNKDTLKEVLALDPEETEKARGLTHKLPQKTSVPNSVGLRQSVSTPVAPTTRKFLSSSPSADEIETRPSPHSGFSVGGSSDSEPSKFAEGNHCNKRSREESSLRESRSETSSDLDNNEVRVRQASPELGTQHVNMPDPRSIRRSARMPESARDCHDPALSANSIIEPSNIQSPTPGFVRKPPSQGFQSRKDSVKTSSKRLSSTPEFIAKQTRKWLSDPNRKRRFVSLEESTSD